MSGTRLVLDTHVWIWLVEGHRRLQGDAVGRLEAAAADGRLLLPAIVPWEVALLTSKGRIKLAAPVREWLPIALRLTGSTLHPLTTDIAVEACYLPGGLHGDPAGRLIVATARLTDATLVTRDADILAYGRAGHVDVLAA